MMEGVTVDSPDLSVVVVTYDCRELALSCIDSLKLGTPDLETEIIVVDNGSHDGTVAALAAAHPDVRLVEVGWNSGFGRACNRGMEAAEGRCILLLNPDTEVQGGALGWLVRFLDSRPDAGVVAPRLLYPDLTDQGTARSFPTAAAAVFGRRSLVTKLYPGNRWSRRYLMGRERSGEQPFEVDWVSGACLMIPRSILARVGMIDEDFFMHWEDAEWCFRIKEAGYGVWTLPAAYVIHQEGGVRGGWPPSQVWHFHRGAYLFWRKCGGGRRWWVLRPLVLGALAARAGMLIIANWVGGMVRGSPASSDTDSSPEAVGREQRGDR
jgi:GT2 family glycosyltransferase